MFHFETEDLKQKALQQVGFIRWRRLCVFVDKSDWPIAEQREISGATNRAISSSKWEQPNAKAREINNQAAQASPKVIKSTSSPTPDSEYDPRRPYLSTRGEDSKSSPRRLYPSTRRRKDQRHHHRVNKQHHSPPLLQTSQDNSEASLSVRFDPIPCNQSLAMAPHHDDVSQTPPPENDLYNICDSTRLSSNQILGVDLLKTPLVPHVVKRPDDDFLPSPSDVEEVGHWRTSRNASGHQWHAEEVYGADMITGRLYQALKKAPKRPWQRCYLQWLNGEEETEGMDGVIGREWRSSEREEPS
ncbi:MAG: hypothetical protein M1836_002160 [Candelina mexicana]|nr:MAG: hypothetical protein M1836_002160 [Candelina mexicana]